MNGNMRAPAAREPSRRDARCGPSSSLIGALVLLLAPSGAAAQAICSAPHSSPTLAQGGAIGTMPAGAGWVQLSGFGSRATEFFNPVGDRQAFLADSEFETRSLFLTGAVAVHDGVELWAQVPVHRLTVDASSGSSESTGVGDVRVAARVGSELFGRALPLALRVGVKIPGSDFPVDATVLPLTEGQTDVEVSLESGTTLGYSPVYMVGWVGYRWRGTNDAAERTPGNETYAHLAVGTSFGRVSWQLGLDGLWGSAPLAQGLRLPSEGRRYLQLLPTAGVALGPGRLEVTAQLPVTGENLPAASGLSVGYRAAWGMLY